MLQRWHRFNQYDLSLQDSKRCPGRSQLLQCLLGQSRTGWPRVPQRKQGGKFYAHTQNTVRIFMYLQTSMYELYTHHRVLIRTNFGLRTVLGEMSERVAVRAVDVLVSIVSVRRPPHSYPDTLAFVIDLSLKNTTLVHQWHHLFSVRSNKLSWMQGWSHWV